MSPHKTLVELRIRIQPQKLPPEQEQPPYQIIVSDGRRQSEVFLELGAPEGELVAVDGIVGSVADDGEVGNVFVVLE